MNAIIRSWEGFKNSHTWFAIEEFIEEKNLGYDVDNSTALWQLNIKILMDKACFFISQSSSPPER